MKPNRENIRLWVEALRSGRYKQGRQTLRQKKDNVIRYCCLGVACNVYKRVTGRGKWITTDVSGTHSFHGQMGVLPGSVADWLGLDDVNPNLLGDIKASSANDTYNWTFEAIADAIEAKYLK